jgi:hypothetical protein
MSSLAWGKKVSPTFRQAVFDSSDRLGCQPDDLMACMAWETGETFSPSIVNGAGSGATGLIQFMPSTAAALGTTTALLARMTAVQQLTCVEKYFRPWKGKLKNLGDLYMAILWPAGIGKPDSYVLFDKADAAHPKRYLQNVGIDMNKDGKVTRGECCAKVQAKLTKGLLPENRWVGP